DLAVFNVLGILAEVPHISEPVLGEEVMGPLGQFSAEVDPVQNDRRRNTHDSLRGAEDDNPINLGLAVLYALVNPGRTGDQRHKGVIDDTAPRRRKMPAGL